ncbi:CMP-N-acetylneuraminate-beta-galactosamide-alpha-2,3-sialyltransferase 1-like isoform X2 [Parambassis ranga]|nr:CMP-N-acetylneuraminate-beta-galactosamide-alpha-2,3-sialyltransferase 1-like isoform X2 [Parambassis ranga]
MSRQNKTSPDGLRWWQSIQGGKPNSTYFNKTVDSLFEIFPPVPSMVASSPSRCITCAVVGNSGNLNRSRYGPLIDFHDIVIRINRGRTKGYETDVGTKTTHHVMYPESANKLPNTTYLLFFPFKISDFLWLHKKFNPEKNKATGLDNFANKDLVMILNPAFMRYVHEDWLGRRGYYPSTGFLTVILSLQMCDEVSVFGFGADSDGNWSHYFEKLTDKRLKTGAHPGTDEYNIIMKLHKKKKITFFRGW